MDVREEQHCNRRIEMKREQGEPMRRDRIPSVPSLCFGTQWDRLMFE